MIADALQDGNKMGTETCRPGVIRDKAQVNTGTPMAIASSEVGS